MSSLSSSTSAIIGGVPTVTLDVPISAVFLSLYLAGAILHISIFTTNRRRGHKFFMTWLLNVFCIIRVVTCSMRIAWATTPKNPSLAIAAQIFNNAGIIIVYIVNLIFSQRIFRAKKPQLGWNKALGLAFNAIYCLIVGTLIMGITVLVISINTTNVRTLQSIRDVTLASATFILVVAILPFIIVMVAYLKPTPCSQESFGTGSMAAKSLVVLSSTCLAIIIAGFKAGTSWQPARLAPDPAWYHSKPAFYCFNFVLEVIILAIFLLSRVDKRLHVPDHCKSPGDYSRLGPDKTEEGDKDQDYYRRKG
ncbi:hypothetical protein JX265_007701 [Neoarthrinium moseri]|uniref:Uncharacterized protein n=1 Tax=Neoarthrinium moseri TaxID=1658444 RepID=A0A9P9WJ90_9PEZI|nr:hypothetical protein JX265_007701 [Neoarthrinium moseri]